MKNRISTIDAFAFALSLLSVTVIVSIADAQTSDPPLANRPLAGSADFGDVGRAVINSQGLLELGTIHLTAQAFADEDPVAPDAAFDIHVHGSGFVQLSNGLLLRPTGGSDAIFTGPGQTQSFDVFRNGPAGRFDFTAAPLAGPTTYDSGNGDTVSAYGGNLQWSAIYNTLAGEAFTVTRNFSNQPSLNAADGPVQRPFATFAPLSASQAASLGVTDPNASSLERRLVAGSEQITRVDPLFSVDAVAGQDTAQIDLTQTAISGAGNQLLNRQIGSQASNQSFSTVTKSLGRVIRAPGTISVDQTDTLTLETVGDDASRTRLNLAAFNSGSGSVTAMSDGGTFTSQDSTATVTVTGNFDIDTNIRGPQSFLVDVGSNISSLENLPGENVQNSLSVGYSFSAVDNNGAVSRDITAFRLDTEPVGTASVFNPATQEFSTSTHTDIRFDPTLSLTGSSRTVALSAGAGIYAEGLANETVTASTTFDIEEIVVDSTRLSVTAADTLDVGDTVRFENQRSVAAGRVQAEAMLVRDRTIGSSRWTLDGINGLQLTAGADITATAMFDATGLATPETGELGKTFRTRVDLTFQDGVRDLSSLASHQVASVVSEGSGAMNIAGSRDSQQTIRLDFERRLDVQSTSGSASLSAGTSLNEQGLNLTNTAANSSNPGDPTRFQIIGGDILESSLVVSAEFFNRNEAAADIVSADGFGLLSSDLLDLNGLDETFHVLELSSDPSLSGDHFLAWLSDGDQWVNAILGNSDIESFDTLANRVTIGGADMQLTDYLTQRAFDGSYWDYLGSLGEDADVELGRYGFADGLAWATIDHNSVFATAVAVPEPSTCVVLVCATLVAGRRLRRRRVK